jgi:hypothetical protein
MAESVVEPLEKVAEEVVQEVKVEVVEEVKTAVVDEVKDIIQIVRQNTSSPAILKEKVLEHLEHKTEEEAKKVMEQVVEAVSGKTISWTCYPWDLTLHITRRSNRTAPPKCEEKPSKPLDESFHSTPEAEESQSTAPPQS